MNKAGIAAILAFCFAQNAYATERMNLNEVGAEQLASLDSVSETLAGEIVALRTARGRLASIDELRVLPSLSEGALSELRSNTDVVLTMSLDSKNNQYDTVEQVLAEFAHEPSVQEAQRWASTYAQVNPELVQRWLRDAKSFALLPELRLEYKYNDGWDNDFDVIAGITGVDPNNPATTLSGAGSDGDNTIQVKTRWALDKLIMSSEQIRVINEAQDVVKLREKVTGEATRFYFERRRAQVEHLLNPKTDILDRVQEELNLLELTANLDALTGGAFSQAISESGKHAN